MMFDLNLSVDCNGKPDHSELQQSPATSISSVVDGGGETSSSNDDAYFTRAASPGAAAVTLNLDIGGGYGESDGDGQLSGTAAGLVTRELFPVSRLGEITESVSLHGPSQMSVQPQVQVRKSRRGPRSRSSQYRGVTFYRRTGRWESHIWDCGKQVYLGGFDTALAAARAYDRAALKFRGLDADINFNITDYDEDMKQTRSLSKEEFVHILRRQSTGFSRGTSKYRGVTLHKCGRWEARMGQYLGKKAYDKAAIKCNGREAVTNFESSSYDGEMLSDQRSSNDLDLNLGMSSGNQRWFQFHPYDVQTTSSSMMKLHVEGSGSGNKHPILLNPKCKERGCQEQVVKWGWHDLCAAASSGFSSSSSPVSSSLNLCFSNAYPPRPPPHYFSLPPPP